MDDTNHFRPKAPPWRTHGVPVLSMVDPGVVRLGDGSGVLNHAVFLHMESSPFLETGWLWKI